MIKIETHCHTYLGSPCATAFPETLIKEYKEKGYGGAVLTNHYCKAYFDNYKGETEQEKKQFFIDLIEDFEKTAHKLNFKAFYGAEILVKTTDNAFREFILVGFDKAFIMANKPLFNYTQTELFEIAEKNRFFLYQTHPQRKTIVFGDTKYMHGAESFNGHINHINRNEQALEFIEKHGLKKMSGTDYHDAGQPITAGIYIPKDINDNLSLANYLRNNQPKLICDEDTYKRLLRKKKEL